VRLASLRRRIEQWIAYRAWQYARKREFTRRKWSTTDALMAQEELTADQRRIMASEAVTVLQNRHFQWAWQALDEYLNAKALSCDGKDREQAQLIVVSKQLLHGLRREFERRAEDGYMAQVEIEQLERRSRMARLVR
jgi:hypothetical protein